MILRYLLPDFSGSTIQAFNLAKAIRSQDDGVDIVFLGIDYASFKFKKKIIDGFSCYTCPGKFFFLNHHLEYISLRLLRMIWIVCYLNRFDIVHLHGSPELLNFLILLKKISPFQLMYKATLSESDELKTILKNKVIKQTNMGMVDNYICISEAIYQNTSSILKKSEIIYKIPNGVDVERHHPISDAEKLMRRKQGSFSDALNIIYFVFNGSVRPRKGLLDAIVLLKSLYYEFGMDFRLFVIGRVRPKRNAAFDDFTEYNNKIRSYMDVNKLGSKVVFLGEISNPEYYVQMSDVYLFASVREGMPNSLLEAMSCGLLVVASSLPGIIDALIMDLKNGIIIDYDDPCRSCEKLIRVLNDKNVFDGLRENARKEILKKYNINDISKRYLMLYDEHELEEKSR